MRGTRRVQNQNPDPSNVGELKEAFLEQWNAYTSRLHQETD